MDDRLTPAQSAEILKSERAAKRSTDDYQLRTWCVLEAIEAHKANPLDGPGEILALARNLYTFMTTANPSIV